MVAGKTGTAQVVSQRDETKDIDEEDLPQEQKDHAWFAAYAPFENPKIAVGVIVEHGGHGGAAAAPIARDVINKYLEIVGYSGEDRSDR